jgi:hypothetical protein
MANRNCRSERFDNLNRNAERRLVAFGIIQVLAERVLGVPFSPLCGET